MRSLPLAPALAVSLALLIVAVPGAARASAGGPSPEAAAEVPVAPPAETPAVDGAPATDGVPATTASDPPHEPEAVADGGPVRRGRVFIDADGLGDAGPVLAGRATANAAALLVEQGVPYTDAPAGPELRIVLSLRERGGYTIAYAIVYDGEVIDDGTGSSECPLCTEGELLGHIEALTRDVASKLVVPEPEPEPPPPIEPEIGIAPNDDQHRGRLGPKGKAGVALTVTGGVTLGVGLGLLIRPPTPLEDDATRRLNTRPLGGLLLGSGVALAVTGVVLLVLDRREAKHREPRVALHPWIGPTVGGLGVTGRF